MTAALDIEVDEEQSKEVWCHDLSVQQCSSSLSKFRVCVDKFNKYLFCCVDRVVKVYSAESGEFLYDLRHDSLVIAVHLYPKNSLQLLSCTADGEISLWNYEEATQLKVWCLDKKICTFLACNKPNSLGFVTVPKDGGETCNVYEVKLEENQLRVKKILRKIPQDYKKIACAYTGDYIAFVNEEKLCIKHLMDKRNVVLYAEPGRKFVCIRCHPTKDCIATGDNLGAITLWFNFFDESRATSSFHWHSNAVSDIAFPTEGSTMYSGGLECVAVKWCLKSSFKEETKEFLSRLGSHVVSLTASPDNKLLAIVLEDNSVQIASSQMQISCTIKSLSTTDWILRQKRRNSQVCPIGLRSLSSQCQFICGLKTGCLMTNGQPGYIQFYDPVRDKQIYALDVIGRNLPPHEAPTYSEVIHADFIGPWLATVEYRHDDVYTGDFALKFCKFDEITQKLDINLHVENPHFKIITSIRFQPLTETKQNMEDGLCLCTTSLDGKVKFWVLGEQKDAKGYLKRTWLCESFLSYRGRPAHCCQFNPNGRVLAVNFGNLLTFWKFDDHRLLLSIPVVSEDNHLKSIEFGSRKHEAKLVCLLSNKGDCSVWDVDSQVKLWSFDYIISCLRLHAPSGRLIGFTEQNAYYFDLSSGAILTSVDIAENTNKSKVVAACFADDLPEALSDENFGHAIPDKDSPLCLYFVTEDQRMMRLCTTDQLDIYNRHKLRKADIIRKHPTNLSILLESAKADLGKKVNSVDARYVEQRANLELLSAPAHTLPGLEVLGRNFIDSCLQPKVPDDHDFASPAEKYNARRQANADDIDPMQEHETMRKKWRKLLKRCDLSFLTDYFSRLL